MTIPYSPPYACHSKLKACADEQMPPSSSGQKILRLVVRLILITVTEFYNNALSLRSAALTYTVLLSLVPILAISTAVIKGLGGDNQLRKSAYSYIETLTDKSGVAGRLTKITPAPQENSLPKNGVNLTDHFRSAVDQLFDYVSQNDNRLLPTSTGKGEDYQKVVASILGTDTADTKGGARSLLAMEAATKASRV